MKKSGRVQSNNDGLSRINWLETVAAIGVCEAEEDEEEDDDEPTDGLEGPIEGE